MSHFTRTATIVFLGVGFALLALANWLVPWVIEEAYYGRSFDKLNAVIEGQSVHSVQYYISAWDVTVQPMLSSYVVGGLLAILIGSFMTRPEFFNRFVGEANPSALGAIRMLVCSLLFLNLQWDDVSSSVLVPPDLREPSGALQMFYALPLFGQFVESPSALRIAKWLTSSLLLCGVVGWQTRYVLPLAAIGWFILGGIIRQSLWFFHQGLTPWYVLVVLLFLPCGDGLSVDRLIRVAKRQVLVSSSPAPIYGWARYVCWAVVAIVYTDAGLSKLLHGGPFWWSPPNIQTILYTDTLNPNDYKWTLSLMLPQWDIVFSALGLAAFLGELFYGLTLFFGWARMIFPPLMLSMHVGIFLFQNILFLDLMLVQLIFLDWTWVRKVITRRLANQQKAIEVLYDGQCPLCRRTVRVLAVLDLFEQLRFTDFRQINIEAYNRQYNISLTIGELDREMYVLDSGRPYVGFYAYRLMGLRLPALWPIVPLLFIPGITHIGIAVYRYIARERLKLLRCDDMCSVETEDSIFASDCTRSVFSPIKPVTIVLSAGLILFGACAFELEYFPISAYPMYSERLDSGVIVHYKVWERNSSGRLQPAHLDEAIPALAHNRYRFRLPLCFDPATLGKCEKYLVAMGEAYNAKVASQQRITAYEVEEWRWSFLVDPKDAQHGRMERRAVVDLRKKTA